MATPLLGLYAPADNADAGNWGHNWNNLGSTVIDQVIAGVQSLTLSSGTVGLSAAQSGAQMLSLNGTLLANVTITNGGNLWNGIRCVENLTSGNFSVTLSQNGTAVIPQGRRCLVFLDTTNGPRLISALGGTSDVPSGTVMPLYQGSAPSGWTISSALNDYGMRIVSSGGGVTSGGSSTYSSVFAQSSTGGYTLQIADIPSHNHSVTGRNLIPGGGNLSWCGGGTEQVISPAIGSTGGGGSHSHSVTLTVQTADFIIATKN